MSARPNSWYQRSKQRLGDEMPYCLIFNFILPWGNFVAYFVNANTNVPRGSYETEDAVVDGMLKNFLHGEWAVTGVCVCTGLERRSVGYCVSAQQYVRS